METINEKTKAALTRSGQLPRLTSTYLIVALLLGLNMLSLPVARAGGVPPPECDPYPDNVAAAPLHQIFAMRGGGLIDATIAYHLYLPCCPGVDCEHLHHSQSGKFHFPAWQTLSVVKSILLFTQTYYQDPLCCVLLHPSWWTTADCGETTESITVCYRDPDLHPTCPGEPDEFVDIRNADIDDVHFGFHFSETVDLLIQGPSGYDEVCCPPVPVPSATEHIDAKLYPVDAQFIYSATDVAQECVSCTNEVLIITQLYPVWLNLDNEPDAVKIEVWDPRDNYGFVVWTDQREKLIYWDGRLFKYKNPELEWHYLRSSDIFMKVTARVKDVVVGGGYVDCDPVESVHFPPAGFEEVEKEIVIPKATFSLRGPEEREICATGQDSSTDLIPTVYIQGEERIAEPHIYRYHFWIPDEWGRYKVDVYEQYLPDDPVLLPALNDGNRVRWDNEPGGTWPDLPDKLIIQAKGVPSSQCGDVRIHFSVGHDDPYNLISISQIHMTILDCE